MVSVDASTTGAYLTGPTGRTQQLAGARLAAAAAAASAIIREVDGSGRILAKLACAIGEADEMVIPINFVTNVHVTIAGAGAQLNLFQA